MSAGLAAAFAAVASQGYTYITVSDTDTMPLRWSTAVTVIPIQILLGTSPTLTDGTNYSTSAQDAAQKWNALLGTIQFQPTIATGTPADGNRVNQLAFASDIYGKAFESTTLAVTTAWISRNRRSEGDIIFNSAKTWDSYAGATRSGVIDLHRVALHELGHVLGLDHPDQTTPPQAVTAIMNSHISSLDALATDDITGAQNLYGPPGVPANDNFANATVITLPNNTAALNGFNTNATKETGEPDHGSNAGTAGHSVWWKWTAPGAGSLTVDTRNSYFDTTLGVYTGTSVNALTTIATNDDIQGGVVTTSSITFTATGSTTYYIAVDGYSNDTGGVESGGITLNLAFAPNGATLPTITTQPTSVTTVSGENVSFTVAAVSGGSPITYQWMFNGAAISGATNATLALNAVTSANAGSYTVVLTTGAGSVTSNPATLTVTPASAPAFTTQPTSQSVTTGAAVSFSVAVSGLPAPTLQWRKDGVSLSGATGATYSIASATAADAGAYTVVATNTSGTATSNPANLTVTTPVVTPPVTTAKSGGGGGGAPSLWFLLSLGTAGLARLLRRR